MDPYDRAARLYPGLLVLAPAAVLGVCLYGMQNVALSGTLSILAVCGIAYALGRVARDAGKRIEARLFDEWGGAPTTQLFRHRDTRIDVHTKQRFHAFVAKGVKRSFPTADFERLHPEDADQLYRAATIWLISQTRDSKAHPLVLREDIGYGFQRNMFGLRPLGLAVTVICLLWALLNAHVIGFVSPYFSAGNIAQLQPSAVVTLGVSVAMLLAWLFLFKKGAVERAGFAYAERLLQSCDRLGGGARSSKQSAEGSPTAK